MTEAAAASRPDVVRALRAGSHAGSVAVVSIAAAVLCGWIFELRVLQSLSPDFPRAKPNSALGFLFAGMALLLQFHGRGRALRRVLASLVVALGCASLTEYAGGVDLGIDRALFNDPSLSPHPGRMSLTTALILTLLGVGILLDERPGRRLADWPALLAGLFALLPLLGYAFGEHDAYHVGPFATMALPTTAAATLASLALLLARPDRGFARFATLTGPAGALARRTLPACLLLPGALGWIRLKGEQIGLYDLQMGLALFAWSIIICFFALTCWNVSQLWSADAARQAADSAVAEAQARFSRLFESGLIGIVVSDMKGQVVEINDALQGLLGYSREEFLSGRPLIGQLTPPKWGHVDRRAVEQLNATGVGSLREKEYRCKDGSLVPVLIGSAMLTGKSGLVISFVLDLSEREQARAAIEKLREERAADAKFRGLLESAPDAMVIMDGGGNIVFANARVETLFGYAPAELVGQRIQLLVPGDLLGSHVEGTAGYSRAPMTHSPRAALELAGRRKDSTEFPIEVSLSPLETADGLLVSSAIRDISERQMAEQYRASLAAIVDSSDDAIIGKTLTGIVTSWNRGAERLFGYRANEIVGRPISMLVPADRQREQAFILEHAARAEVLRFDTVRRRKDGRAVDVSLTISPVPNAVGAVIGISEVSRDITERRRFETELAVARDTAEAASRELEAFSYSVAHDLRAPLRGMNGFAQLLIDSYYDRFDSEGQDFLREILGNAKKMAELIDALLALSRVTRSELKRDHVDLSAMARAIGAELRAVEPGRTVELIIEENLRVEMDPTLARAALANLLGNAWKFTGNSERPRIELGTTTHVTDSAQRVYYVRDNGAGFDMAFANKLFAPFQRLHTTREFPGTGIGLATVQRVFGRHGGRIWAEGAVGAGATFFFSLPFSAARSPSTTIELGPDAVSAEFGILGTLLEETNGYEG